MRLLKPLFRNSSLSQSANYPPLAVRFLAYRVYGDPKLPKPKELKGMKPAWKCELMKKPVRIYEMPDGSLVVYFGNLFSRPMAFPDPKDMALPTSAIVAKYPERFENGRKNFKGFVYADAWCPIYERNEGYVVFEGLRERCADTFDCYTPRLSADIFDQFRKLSLDSKGFIDIANHDDDIAANYRRFIEDLVSRYYCESRQRP